MSDLSASELDWDFFLAHSSADAQPAEELYSLITQKSYLRPVRVFLDTRSLKLGDDWDIVLAKAQRSSKVTVVLVSNRTDSAYYQREEVAAAIAMAREDGKRHRVVPLFLDDAKDARNAIPYGLRLKHGLRVSGSDEMRSVAYRLLDLLNDIDNIPGAVLDARTATIEGAPDKAQELSLKTLADSTSNAGAAIHAFVAAMEGMVRSGVRTLDFLTDRRERSRLRKLLQRLMMIEHSQAPLPWLLRGYGRNRDSKVDNWHQVIRTMASLTPEVAEVTELLATTNGDFVISARDAYKSLLFGLRGRSRLYEELRSLDPPSSTEDFAYIETIAAQYEVMIEDLKRAQEAIARYLDQ